MLTAFLLTLHVCSATVGLLSGFLAMVLRKGSGLHGAAGTVFFVSMLSASGSGGNLAAFIHPNSANLMASALTFYLVATAWVAARRREGKPGLFDPRGCAQPTFPMCRMFWSPGRCFSGCIACPFASGCR